MRSFIRNSLKPKDVDLNQPIQHSNKENESE